MATGFNRQDVIGNLAGDAELRTVGEKGTPKLSFRVIANTGYGDYEHTEGFNVILWGKRAEGLAPHLTKGKKVFVTGETRTHSWDGEDGQKKYRTELVASDIVLLGGGAGAGDDADRGGGELEGEEIPF